MSDKPKVGDILFLERSVPSLPWPSGFWVLCRLSEATAYVALVGGGKRPKAIDNWYKISVEELDAFSGTGHDADVPEPSEEGLKQAWDYQKEIDEERRNS